MIIHVCSVTGHIENLLPRQALGGSLLPGSFFQKSKGSLINDETHIKMKIHVSTLEWNMRLWSMVNFTKWYIDSIKCTISYNLNSHNRERRRAFIFNYSVYLIVYVMYFSSINRYCLIVLLSLLDTSSSHINYTVCYRCLLLKHWSCEVGKYGIACGKRAVCHVMFQYAILLAFGSHDDVIKWKHFPHYWPFVRVIHRSPVDYPYKDRWRGALIFSLICAWTNS